MPAVGVLDSTMYYETMDRETTDHETTDHEAMDHEGGGGGTVLVFLHGNPASSRLWRNVAPRVGRPRVGTPGRTLAPDLIGMGRSGKPDIGYRFADHARYLDAWFDALGLDDVVLVGHDWGGALAFDWAARHPDRVRGVAFMEAIVRPMSWAEFPAAARSRFEAFRTPGLGETLVLDQNVFLEQAFTAAVRTRVPEEDLAAYREPYPTRDSRRPLLAWPRAMPLGGEPADVVERVERYDAWLARSDGVPKLLLTFDSSPTLMIGEAMAAWCAANIASLEIQHCGPAGHHAPEDQPEAIAAAIAAWLDRHGLRDRQPTGEPSQLQ